MAGKVQFTEQEAALLLDAYLKARQGELAQGEAVHACSSKLRQMAINAGIKIEDSYRNVSCIWPQMASMDSAYKGDISIREPPRLFTETVLLYKNNPSKYQELLKEAESMASGNKDDEASLNPYAYSDEAFQPELDYGGGATARGLSDIEIAFLRYLKEETSLSERTRSNYVYYIRKAERLAQKVALSSTRLFTEDVAEARATADALFASEDCIQHLHRRGYNFKAAIRSLIAFYESVGGAQDPAHGADHLTAPSFDVEPYLAILKDHFPNGYPLSSFIAQEKMRLLYKELTGAEMDIDQKAVNAALRRHCIEYEGALYVPQSLLSDELSELVFSFIDGCLDEGRAAVEYKAIFEELDLRSCRGNRILNAKMLKAYLEHCAGSKYFFGKKGVARERGADADSVAEVREYLRELCAPAKTAAICKALPHIAEDNVRFILRHNSEFVSNGNDEYFFADALQLDDEELETIAHLMERLIGAAIEEPKFITASDLYNAVQKTQKSAFERNAAFSAVGWKNALKHKLAGLKRFAIGSIISMAGGPASKGDLFAAYGKWHKQFSISEVEQLAKSVGLPRIPFDALNKSAIRISRDCFAAKDDVRFSVAETDAALARLMDERQYMPIKGIETAALPDAGFAWTEFLLEQYAGLYSEAFCLLHSGYSKKGAFGAIARRPQPFNSFDDLLADALANSGVPLAADDALDYLADSRYLPRPQYKAIESVLSKAKRIKERAQG